MPIDVAAPRGSVLQLNTCHASGIVSHNNRLMQSRKNEEKAGMARARSHHRIDGGEKPRTSGRL